MSDLHQPQHSGPDHPDHKDPWALQLVVHRVKAAPALHRDVLAAAATAVVRLLDDPRSHDDGDWATAVRHWRAGWIRKVTRRAENKRWDDVQHLPGLTVTVNHTQNSTSAAEVRALVPGPLTPLPPEVKKLQVGGTEFPRSIEPALSAQPQAGAVVTVVMAPGLELSTGKAAAQAGHAAQLAYERLCVIAAEPNSDSPAATALLDAWRADGFRVNVMEPAAAQDPAWARQDHPIRVVDAGLTEVNGPTETARAFW